MVPATVVRLAHRHRIVCEVDIAVVAEELGHREKKNCFRKDKEAVYLSKRTVSTLLNALSIRRLEEYKLVRRANLEDGEQR